MIKRIPKKTMRLMTRPQLKVIATQKNVKRNNYTENANYAQALLWSDKHTNYQEDMHYLGEVDYVWTIPAVKTIEIDEWLNGTENLALLEES